MNIITSKALPKASYINFFKICNDSMTETLAYGVEVTLSTVTSET